jgi:hypothetical protein
LAGNIHPFANLRKTKGGKDERQLKPSRLFFGARKLIEIRSGVAARRFGAAACRLSQSLECEPSCANFASQKSNQKERFRPLRGAGSTFYLHSIWRVAVREGNVSNRVWTSGVEALPCD